MERLERLELVCAWLGLGIFALALAAGGFMAHYLNPPRPFWSDPKTLAAVVTFMVFGALALGRTARWLHGRAAALVVLGGAALVLLTFVLSHPLGRPAGGPVGVHESGLRVVGSAGEKTNSRWRYFTRSPDHTITRWLEGSITRTRGARV